MIVINTKTGEIKKSDLETDKKNLIPQSYEMPDMSKYDEPKKSKRGRKATGSKKVEKQVPVKQLKEEVYATLNLKNGDNGSVKRLAGFIFFNSEKGKYESLVKRTTWEAIIEGLQDDNFGTKSNDWIEFQKQQQASKPESKSENKKGHVGRPKGSKNKTEKTETVTGEPTMKGLKQVVYELLGVNDTAGAKDKAKELGIDIKGLSLRSKLGWESFRKRAVRKLNPPVKESSIIEVDSATKSTTSKTSVETDTTLPVIENVLETAESLEAKLSSHWSRTRASIYKELKSQKKTTQQCQSITRMLQECKKALEVNDFNDVLEVNGLSQFMYKAS